MSFIAQLFRGPNGNYDLGRLLGAKSVSAYTACFLWSVLKIGAVPDWSSLGVGYAAVMAGAGALICAKDLGVAKANATTPAEPLPTPPAETRV